MTSVHSVGEEDELLVRNTLRLYWRMEVPKQFNLSEVLSEQPYAHGITGLVVFLVFLLSSSYSTVVISLPITYILLFLLMLMLFFVHVDAVFLKELLNISETFQSKERSHFWIITEGEDEDKEIVGALGLCEKNEKTALVKHLYVKDKHGKQLDLLKLLLQKGFEFSKEKKYSEIEIWTPRVPDDIAVLYQNMGLKIVGDLKMPFKGVFIMTVYVLHMKLEKLDLQFLSTKED